MLSGRLALLWTLNLNNRWEATEDWRHRRRDEGRTQQIRESNNTFTTPTLTHAHGENHKHSTVCTVHMRGGAGRVEYV